MSCLALPVFLHAGFWMHVARTQLDALAATRIGTAVKMRAVMTSGHGRTGDQIRIDTVDGSSITCTRDFCDYPDMYRDIGREITLWMSAGFIIQVERNGVVEDMRERKLEQLRGDLRKTWHGVIAGAVCVLLGQRAMWRAKHPPPPGPPIQRRLMR